MKKLVIILLGVSLSISGWSQRVDIEWIELSGNKVIIHYDLEDTNPNHQYIINLYTSQDKFTAPLNRVAGDVGQEVRPGEDKAIVWDITKELGDFKGKLTFEIRGRVFIPFVKLEPIEPGKTFIRGGNYPINWTSGNVNGQVNIELFKGQVRIPVENGVPNVGKYEWNIPMSLKPGSDYSLRFTNARDHNEFVNSGTFTIRPKFPLWAKLAGGVAVATGLVFILSSGGNGTTVTDSSLPSNPGTPPN